MTRVVAKLTFFKVFFKKFLCHGLRYASTFAKPVFFRRKKRRRGGEENGKIVVIRQRRSFLTGEEEKMCHMANHSSPLPFFHPPPSKLENRRGEMKLLHILSISARGIFTVLLVSRDQISHNPRRLPLPPKKSVRFNIPCFPKNSGVSSSQ